MVTETHRSLFDFCSEMTDTEDQLARETLARFAARWPLYVLHVLAEADGPLRFSRVLERVEGISQKVLTQTLRMLERDGLVIRTLYPQVPPRVEYQLTPLGGELLRQMVPLWKWIVESMPAFGEARDRKAADAASPVPAETGGGVRGVP